MEKIAQTRQRLVQVPVTATWQDPTADHSIAAGNSLTGSQVFKTPGNNDGGDTDWVLVLTAP
jgi:hypothetical protein